MEKEIIRNAEFDIKRAKIIETKQMTEYEKFFNITLLDEKNLGHDPGQFVEVSLFGIGEAPLSISSSPTQRGSFDLVVRAAGKVTSALHKLNEGDEVGIRGPFGKGFPVQLLEGNDLLFIAGGLGIVPLRSLINYVIDNRRDFGRVNILLGCKSPKDMLFSDETDNWSKRLDVNFNCTVDMATPGWEGNVGLITSLIPDIDLDHEHTYAIVVGPPVMYKFVIQELLMKDIPDKKILLSLERHMKCGVGKCGHCQIDGVYCCQDGPVFSYHDIKKLHGAI